MKNRFPTGKFTLSIFLLLSFLFILVMPIQAKVNFSDIDGHWAESAIQKMADQGIVKGFPDGSFKPENSITRAEFATLIVQAFKLESKNGKVFSDTSQHWAKEFIATANAHGIVNGYNDSIFKPDNKISREEMAVMIVKAAKPQINSEFLECTDGDQVSSWAKNAVATAYVNNIITGMPDGSFLPLNNASRAEAVIVLNKGMQFILPASFMPAGNISANTSETASSVTSISIQSAPKKVSYTAGEKLDLSGLAVTLTKSDGSTENVALGDFAAKGITVSPANGAVLTTNDTAVVITVNGKTTSQKISVAALAAGGGGGGGGGGGAPTVAVAGVTLDQETLTLTVGGADGTLTATVAPANASNKKVSWTSSDEDVATVDNGVVTPVAAGAATITVTTEDGSFTDTCTVTVNDGGTTPTEPDKSDLKAAIDAANANANATKTSTDGTDVDPADKWVTQEDMNAYLAAIDSAQDVFDDPDATQEEIDAALADLQDAASAFDAAKAAGTKPAVTTDKSDLKDAIDAANANAAATEVSNDGSDIDPANKWVTQEDMNAYLDAIDSAQNVFDDPDATQEEIDAALADLQDATSAFNASKAAGTFDGGSDVTVENVTAEYRTSMVNWYRFDVIGDYNTVQIKTDDGTDLGPAMTEAAFEDAGYYQGGVAPNDIIVIYVDGVIAWSGEPKAYCTVENVTAESRTSLVNWYRFDVIGDYNEVMIKTTDGIDLGPVLSKSAFESVGYYQGGVSPDGIIVIYVDGVEKYRNVPGTYSSPIVTVTDVSIKTPPAKVTYFAGDALDLRGLAVTLYKSNGTTEDVSLADFAAKGITTTPANGAALTISNTTVTITVDGKNATQPITVNAVTVTGVSVKTPPSKVTYFAGDALNLSGLVVTLYKSNGTTEDVSLADFAAKGITTSPANGATLNTNDKKVTITVNGKKATQPITVNAVTVTGVSVKTPPANVTYYDGELLDLTGLVVTLTKSNGMTEDVALKDFASKGITTDPGNGSALTNTTSKVMITANGQTCWQAITVNQVTVDNVRADRSSLIYTYYYFDIYGDYDEVYITDYLGTKYGGTFTKEEFEAQGYIRTVKMSTTTIKIFVDGVLRFEGIPKLI